MIKAVLRKEFISNTGVPVTLHLSDDQGDKCAIAVSMKYLASKSSYFKSMMNNGSYLLHIPGIGVTDLMKYINALSGQCNADDQCHILTTISLNHYLGVSNPKTIDYTPSPHEIQAFLNVLRIVYRMQEWCYIRLINLSIGIPWLLDHERSMIATFKFTYMNQNQCYLYGQNEPLIDQQMIHWRARNQYIGLGPDRFIKLVHKTGFVVLSPGRIKIDDQNVYHIISNTITLYSYETGEKIAWLCKSKISEVECINGRVFFISHHELFEWIYKISRFELVRDSVPYIWVNLTDVRIAMTEFFGDVCHQIHSWTNDKGCECKVYRAINHLIILYPNAEPRRLYFKCIHPMNDPAHYLIHYNRIFYCTGNVVMFYDLESDLEIYVCAGDRLVNIYECNSV